MNDATIDPPRASISKVKPYGAKARDEPTQNGAEYHPIGRDVIVGTVYSFLGLVDRQAKQVLLSWQFPGWIRSATFTAHGRHVITGNGTVYVLRLEK